ncbi:hypothetical protein PRNP1_010356 [Phytophthora ramorum]
MSDSERRCRVGASIIAELETDCAQLPQYGTMLAFGVYEDEASHEFCIKPRYENEEVFFAGHAQDPLCPFSHFESLALEFLSYKA